MFTNIGVLAAIGAMLCWGIGDFYIQKVTRKLGAVESLLFIGLIGSIILLPFVYTELPLIFSSYNIAFSLFILGLITLFVSIINFHALKEGKLSVIDPIFEFELPITIIIAVILFQERLSLIQTFLAVLIFAGILLISFSKLKFKSKHLFEKGVFLAILTAIGFGVINVYTGYLARQTSPLLAIWSAWTVFAFFCLVYVWHKKGLKQLFKDANKHKKIIFAESIFYTPAWVFFAISMVALPISIATAITQGYPAIAILLGILINKEIVKKHQIVGMTIALTASITLAILI